MPEVLRLDGLTAKIQPTSGTDSVPAVGTDGVRLARRLWSSISIDYEWENMRNEAASGSIFPLKPAIPRGRNVTLDIFWEAKGAGVDAVVEAAPLLRACGMAETDGTQLFSYTFASSSHEMASIYAYAGGKRFQVIDCRGRWRWPMSVGEHCIMQFTMRGVMLVEPATASLPAITYDTTDPIACVNTALTINGSTFPEWQSATFDPVGNDLQLLASGNAAGGGNLIDGIAGFDFADVDPSFELSLRAPVLATYDPYALLKARTTQAMLITWGTTQFNRIKLVAPTNVCLKRIRHADSEGFANMVLEYFVEGFTLQTD
jgi:hypothetical protein